LREDINIDVLDKYWICSKHFEGGKPAELYDITNLGWLPTLHLGHEKHAAVTRDDSVTIGMRAKEKQKENCFRRFGTTVTCNYI